MKEKEKIITLDKSEYREIPAPEANPFRKKQEEWIKKIRLNSIRKQLAEMPFLDFIAPIHELPEKTPDFVPRNQFFEMLEVTFSFFVDAGKALFSKDKGDKK